MPEEKPGTCLMDAQTSLQVQEKPWRKQPASPFMLSLRISDSFFPFLISLCCPPGKWELEGGGALSFLHLCCLRSLQ